MLDSVYRTELKSQAETVADNVDAFGTWVSQYGRVWVRDNDKSFLGQVTLVNAPDATGTGASAPADVWHFYSKNPALAQRAGLQGFVKLQVRVKKDGSIEVQKLLEGEPALADAAIASVKQWRARPALTCGQSVEVISTVTFNFQLH